nr:MAG TPA: His-Me finger endonuclease beta4-alpha2 domain [Caudoviricetes sp.]
MSKNNNYAKKHLSCDRCHRQKYLFFILTNILNYAKIDYRKESCRRCYQHPR